ncbi:MgtC/SapB family protein, partial [Chloroflexota bacterium]
AMLSDEFGASWILVITIFGAILFTAIGYFNDAWHRNQMGITTEISIVLSVLIGALCYQGHLVTAAALGIATTVILSIKLATDQFVKALTRKELIAALQLAVISVIILPLLPNQSIGPEPFDALNLNKIWWMVVLISAINFSGYIAVKIAGPKQGIGIAGLLGGLASSTAVTLSFSERSQREDHLGKPFAVAIIAAWTVMFARVLVEVGVINPDLLNVVWIPIAAVGVVALVYSIYLYLSQKAVDEKGEVDISSPLDLASAIKFGLLYALVLLISRVAMLEFGNTGLYISSILSGLADVDAITLSMAELSLGGRLNYSIATRAIVFAAMSNTVVKGGIVVFSGSPSLRKALAPGLILILITGIGTAFFM